MPSSRHTIDKIRFLFESNYSYEKFSDSPPLQCLLNRIARTDHGTKDKAPVDISRQRLKRRRMIGHAKGLFRNNQQISINGTQRVGLIKVLLPTIIGVGGSFILYSRFSTESAGSSGLEAFLDGWHGVFVYIRLRQS